MSDINFDGLQKFLNDFKNTVKEANELKSSLERLIEKVDLTTKDVENIKETTNKLISYSSLTDSEKTELVADINDWEVGELVKIGDKRKVGAIAYECIQEHTTQSDWVPSNTPALWKIFVPQKTSSGEEVVPEFKQPTGAHDTYKIGDKVIFEGKVYESLIDNNAYSPSDYPQGWKLIIV